MSKKKKSEAKLRRRSEKRARKAAKKAQYEAWKLAGKNSKSRRARKQEKRKSVRNARHLKGPCGNIGCKKCNPIPENMTPSLRQSVVLH